MKTSVKIVSVFVLATLVGAGATYLIKSMQPKKTPVIMGGATLPGGHEIASESKSVAAPINESEVVATVPVLVTTKVRVSPNIGRLSYYYSASGFSVEGETEGITYVMTDNEGHSYSSEDGVFPQIVANSSGVYTVIARNNATGLESEPKTVGGFNELKPITNQLTAAELTQLIQTGDYDGCRSRLDGKVREKVTVRCSNPEYKYNTLQEVFLSVGLDNWEVKVSSVDYDCLNRVMAINFVATK